MKRWTWIQREVILAVHEAQLAEHGGGAGIRDLGLLESALARPENLAAYGKPDAAELAALESPIAAALARLIGEPQSFAAPDPAAYAPYTARAVSGQFAEIFDRLTGR